MKKHPFIRKQFYLTKQQCKNLQIESETKCLSEAEILRRILDEHYKNKEELKNEKNNKE